LGVVALLVSANGPVAAAVWNVNLGTSTVPNGSTAPGGGGDWNNISSNGAYSINDSAGGSAIDLTVSGGTHWNTNGTFDKPIFQGYQKAGPNTYTFSGLNTGSTYDLYVYGAWTWPYSSGTTDRTFNVTQGIPSNFSSGIINNDGYVTGHGFVLADPADGTPNTENYLVFEDIKPAGGTIWFTMAGGNAGTSGFQLVSGPPASGPLDEVLYTFLPGNLRNDHAGTVGVQFTTPADPLPVSHLGFVDVNQDGLSQDHRVGLWNSDGSSLLASATVSAGTGDLLENGFRWVELSTPYDLDPNTTYLLGAETFSGGDQWHNYTTATNDTLNPAFAITNEIPKWGGGAWPAAPTNGAGAGLYCAGNLAYVIPEPSTFVLTALGVLGLLGCVRRRRR